MPDRERIIEGLEHCRIGDCVGCPYDQTREETLRSRRFVLACNEQLTEDILSLLKEQETANLYKCPNCGTWVSAENVVRCKECKFGEACKNGAGEHGVMCYNSQSASHLWVHEPDWFCADGERGDDL